MIRMIALGLIGALYAVALFLSPHGFMMTDLPRVEKVADLPDSAIPYDIRYRLERVAIQFPNNRPDLPLEASRPALGWSFRNFEALKLPFAAYGDQNGFVMYAESRKWLQVIPLDAEALAAINAAAGRDLTAGYKFQAWKYAWGWVFVVLLLLWLFFQFRHEHLARKAEEAEEAAAWERESQG